MIMKLGFRGGVVPTLNVFDNASETRATVLIVSIDFYNASIDERNFHTLRVGGANEGKPGVLIIDGTRVNDVRVYEDGIVPTVISRYGTGGGNVPMVFSHTQGLDIQASEENSPTLRTGGAGMAVSTKQTVRRLTPIECERLQGFPDDWTSGQADSNRYKQMGNAVAVPVVEWVVGRLVAQLSE